jgi:parvulin-like peptidyl-prolyl isomerase
VVQFLVFGAIVFAITKRSNDDRVIDLSRRDLDVALQAEAQKHPTASTTASDVDERAIEDELLYREGLRLGLDREDGIVRQRVIQKMLYYAEELDGATQPPTDAQLRAFYEANRSEWLRPATIAFDQIFAKDRASLDAMRAKIAAGADPKSVSEASPVAFEVRLSKDRIADALGPSFSDALPTAPTSTFGDPIASTYGWHSVRVLSIDAEAVAPFGDVKGRVIEEYVVARREDAIAKYLETVFGQYRVRIDGVRVDRITPSRRLALRTESSGED